MLRIENLRVKYSSTGALVLDKVNFSVDKGEVIALIGPSGCGKTTLLNTIAGLFEAGEIIQEGKILLDAKKVTTVFQEPRLLPWKNVLNNVSFALEAAKVDKEVARNQASKILKKVSLTEYAKFYPSQLSLGMKQRVNFARAMVAKPDLLLMDEPFSALDEVTKYEIIKEFKNILKKDKITTIFVTHNQAEAKLLADRIITLNINFVGVSTNPAKSNTRNKIYGGLWEID